MNTNRAADERERLLARTITIYGRYDSSGRSARWGEGSRGAQIMTADHDAKVIRSLGHVVDQVILDVGCGGGAMALAIEKAASRPRRYVGIDLIERRVARARNSVPWGEFIVASADRIPMPGSSVDLILASTLFSSIPEAWFRNSIAAELARVLRPAGKIVVYDLRYPSPGNPNIQPIRERDLATMFPGWRITSETMTLLPPLARSPLGAGRRRYALLSALPFLRSHQLSVISRA